MWRIRRTPKIFNVHAIASPELLQSLNAPNNRSTNRISHQLLRSTLSSTRVAEKILAQCDIFKIRNTWNVFNKLDFFPTFLAHFTTKLSCSIFLFTCACLCTLYSCINRVCKYFEVLSDSSLFLSVVQYMVFLALPFYRCLFNFATFRSIFPLNGCK